MTKTAAFPLPKLFTGLKMSITDIPLNPPSLRNDLIKAITDNGAFFKSGYSQSTEILLVGRSEINQKRVREGKKSEKIEKAAFWDEEERGKGLMPRRYVLWVEWLEDSLRAKRRLPFDAYDWRTTSAPADERSRALRSPRYSLSWLSRSTAPSSGNRVLHEDTMMPDQIEESISQNRSLKRTAATDLVDDVVEQVAARKRPRTGLDMDDLLLRQPTRAPLAPTTSFVGSLAQISIEPPPSKPADGTTGSMLSKLQQGRSASFVSKAPSRKALQRTVSAPAPAPSPPEAKPFFRGTVFSYRGLTSDVAGKLPKLVERGGGRFTHDASDPSVTHVVIPFIKCVALPDFELPVAEPNVQPFAYRSRSP